MLEKQYELYALFHTSKEERQCALHQRYSLKQHTRIDNNVILKKAMFIADLTKFIQEISKGEVSNLLRVDPAILDGLTEEGVGVACTTSKVAP